MYSQASWTFCTNIFVYFFIFFPGWPFPILCNCGLFCFIVCAINICLFQVKFQALVVVTISLVSLDLTFSTPCSSIKSCTISDWIDLMIHSCCKSLWIDTDIFLRTCSSLGAVQVYSPQSNMQMSVLHSVGYWKLQAFRKDYVTISHQYIGVDFYKKVP